MNSIRRLVLLGSSTGRMNVYSRVAMGKVRLLFSVLRTFIFVQASVDTGRVAGDQLRILVRSVDIRR